MYVLLWQTVYVLTFDDILVLISLIASKQKKQAST